jgi:hypothetical protein
LKPLLITLWKVGGPFLTPNGIMIQTKAPQSVPKVVLYLSDGILYIHLKTNKFHTLLYCLVPHQKMAKDKDFFLVALFNFLKSTQVLNFPFFLSTTTMGDNHVASFIG